MYSLCLGDFWYNLSMTTCIVPLLIIFPVNVGKAYALFKTKVNLANILVISTNIQLLMKKGFADVTSIVEYCLKYSLYM